MHSPQPVSSSTVVPAAAQVNLALLAQGRDLIRQLGNDRYAARVPQCFNASAGGHFRHVIEHYQALLHALSTREIDYENRARDVRIEQGADAAMTAIEEIETGLRGLAETNGEDRPLSVFAESASGERMATSFGRELEFSISHTVHHYALIALVAQAQGVMPPADFGFAPSTLKHLQTRSAACAR